jgi:anti-sigma regulatory factor (Ser/Thr protein kinase)
MEGYSERFACHLELTLHEAFINAVIHGNCENAALPVSILFRSGHSSEGPFLQVEVRDSGEGFRMDEIVDPTSRERVRALSGRGVHIIRHFAEMLHLDSGSDGSVLTLRYIPH